MLVGKSDEAHIDEKSQISEKNKINSKELRDSPKEPRSWFRRVGVRAWAICPGLASPGPARRPGPCLGLTGAGLIRPGPV